MQKKLAVLFVLVLLAFVGLSARLVVINKENGEKYKKQVLSQQEYDSKTIPFRRGDILDSKGTKLAVSEKVYNVILDAKIMLDDEKAVEPTIAAVQSELGIDGSVIRERLASHPESSYYVLKKQMTYEEISGFKALEVDKEQGTNIKGIWFEEEYKRKYPNNTLASDAIGFTTSDNQGLYGLEQYYNDVLSGTPGREYGYLNGDAALERTTIAAVDGNSIVTTIDANIQSIVEKYLKEFDDQYKNNHLERNGSNNTGCIIMDVNTGEILAMASYPVFDLNNTKNSEDLIGMPMVDELGNKTGEYITAENLAAMEGTEQLDQNFNALWRNFCINDTYEPGSVAKPFTVAAGIDSGSITGNETYTCNGFLEVGDYKIKCHNIYGDGPLTVAQGVERSCNVVMMYVNMATGKDTYIDYQHIFNFGLKTNIDLAGESRTASLVYDKNSLGPTELATNSFGQGFNVTMIQMIAGFCSLINGGNYYEPHMVSKIVSPSGATVQNIEPRILKQTVSESTSEIIKEDCNLVVSGENGTGKTARPAGYMIGGKTGTAETLPRGNNEYVVSFMGYAPANDPQIAIYVVVDRPNVTYQDDAKYATRIVRKILTEVLPYKGIFMTEELSDDERAELEALQIEITTPVAPETTDEDSQTADGAQGDASGGTSGAEDGTGKAQAQNGEEGNDYTEVWKTFPIDPQTGYAIDPETGELVDPETGHSVTGENSTPAGRTGANGTSGSGSSQDDGNPF
ncbi:stage V sporulation protein D (sporulation-specific penicillin-binding protein) [Kineothrix alysoides]|uniref:Stage V sporulation protein D (Sporulation-specific penicillin-binding protein) n=2 Tax=Kineothrix alysoides TaxID=1469948 RepID=A0A4R1R3X9_9FIRM|nr:stage V sporulation protein D (sporulation-specific penicillin-binding protein) [Kineothrix alysoides]